MHKLPSVELLHQLLEEKEPGVLYNKVDRANSALAGAVAGSMHQQLDRYWKIMVGGTSYKRYRLIWKMHHGKDPLGFIDHINGDTFDDRIENLRDVVLGENARNTGIIRDGSSYVNLREFVSNSLTIHNGLELRLGLWPDEDGEAIQQELHNAVAPIIDRIYDNRRGRQRPPSPRVVLSTNGGASNGNAKPAYRRF
jgi:hypothetical protein